MKLKALDQIHISSVRADSLRRGDRFAVSDALGAELLARHPGKFEEVGDDERPAASPAAPVKAEKAAPPPPNKAAPAHPDKADNRRKTRARA